jgi:hypothetical protein
MKLGMTVNSVQQETEGTTITADSSFLAFPWWDRENYMKPQPFQNRNDSTLHIKNCHLAQNNLQPFERPTSECCIDLIIKH